MKGFVEVPYCGRTLYLCTKCRRLKGRHRRVEGVLRCPKKKQGPIHDVEYYASEKLRCARAFNRARKRVESALRAQSLTKITDAQWAVLRTEFV